MDSKERFSSRVADYKAYRPGYPADVLRILREEAGLRPDSVVADIGSGTGIFTRLLLGNAARVHAVEPNAGMRRAAEEDLGSEPGFQSVPAAAEATGLPGNSVDLITVAQAFHWFDEEACKVEFARILRRGRCCALIWNDRHVEGGGFQEAYEHFLNANIPGAGHRGMREAFDDGSIGKFFSPERFRYHELENSQTFDFQGLKGRLLSSSYAPEAGQENHGRIMEELAGLFDRHARNGTVTFAYRTRVYVGRLPGSGRA